MTPPYEKKAAVLQIKNLSLSFNGHQVLRDINAEILDIVRPDIIQGQIVAILGPSGVGKTVLSRTIAGLQKPTSGEILVGLEHQPTHRGLVGMVDQAYILFHWATVAENLEIAGRQAGLSPEAIHDKAQGFIAEFKLREYLTMYPCTLSGGTRQRVAICQQLMCSDHLLIADEPFSGLDPVMKKRACDLIVKIANLDELNTILVVTHDIQQACMIADTLWLLGFDKDGDKFLPGARIVEQYDLAAMGFAWHPELADDQSFRDFVHQVTDRFSTLKEF